jgi:mannosyltransferase OCH1-like enzyme
LWDDERNKSLVNESFPDLLQHYDSLAYKSGVMRYIYLYEHGGAYADMFVESIEPLDALLGSNSLVLFNEVGKDGVKTISESLLASIPRHPFIKEVIRQIILTLSVGNETVVSGSHVLTRAFNQFISNKTNRAWKSNIKQVEFSPQTRGIAACSSTNKLFDRVNCKTYINTQSNGVLAYFPDVLYSDEIDFDSCETSECYRSKFTKMRNTLSNSLPDNVAFSSRCDSSLKGMIC